MNNEVRDSGGGFFGRGPPAAEDQIRFLANIERLLNEGQFVATYKYALLIALLDLAIERGNDSGARLDIAVTEIAAKFIELYWRQALPYSSSDTGEGTLLHQNTGLQAAAINVLAKARKKHMTLARAQGSNDWNRLITNVAELIARMPLGKLQIINREPVEFLYVIDHRAKHVEMLPGVVYNLRHFAPLIRRLVQAEWLTFIQNLKQNQNVLGHATALSSFLFGDDRAALINLRPRLLEIQNGHCFYCQRVIRAESEVDHFIPWSRYPRDLTHNFVLAHPACNAAKSDFLAAEHHLSRWTERNTRHGGELVQMASGAGFLSDKQTSFCIARWAYEHAEQVGAQVWMRQKEFGKLSEDWRLSLV